MTSSNDNESDNVESSKLLSKDTSNDGNDIKATSSNCNIESNEAKEQDTTKVETAVEMLDEQGNLRSLCYVL